VDLGRLIRFNTERNTSVAGVQGYLGGLARAARAGAVECDPPGDEQRLLLSIAERSGAVKLEPAAGGRLRLTLSGRLDAAAAQRAIRVARDRGWEAYRAIERFISSDACRRRQLLDHFGDPAPGAPSGRCCDVCDADSALARAAVQVAPAARGARRGAAGRAAAPAGAGTGTPPAGPPVDPGALEALKAWRMERAAGKPAYTVASNATLEAILRRRPASTRELLEIRGVGPAFCERHADSLLEILGRL
jgi:ATP-dependent DNA helicase RecQ